MITPDLFNPVRLVAIEAPNRIVMAPLTRVRAGSGRVPAPVVAEYCAHRATAGLVVIETVANATVHTIKGSRASTNQQRPLQY